MARPFRFGYGLFFTDTPAQWIEQARKAEALGYSTFSIPDHFQKQFAPVPALMAVAATTSVLRVGSFVFDNDFRHPALLAKEAATIDFLSGGRFEFGIGAGWAEADYTRTGIPLDRPGVRIERMAEAVTVIKRLLGGGPVSFSGRYYQIEQLENFPPPAQQPRPPLLIGGGGKRILSLAAREADIVSLLVSRRPSEGGPTESPAALLALMAGWVREAAGERYPELELNTFLFDVAVAEDRQGALEQIGRKRGVPPEDVLNTIHCLAGSPGEISERLQQWREELGITYITVVGVQSMEAMAPVVARLSGT